MGSEFDLVSPIYYPPGVLQQTSSQMMPQQSFSKLLSIRLRRYDYYPGEVVEGNIILQNPQQMILHDIFLNLSIVQNWSIQEDPPNAELNEQLLLSIAVGVAKVLKISTTSSLISLNPGLFNFPFKFQLPNNLEPSFEFPLNNKRSYLRYILKAQIISQYASGQGNLYLFVKTRPKPLKCPLEFTSSPNVQKWGMIKQGSTTLKVTYPKTFYQIRGQIPFTVDIDNRNGKSDVKSVNAKLIRRVQYKKMQDVKPRYNIEKTISERKFAVNVPHNTVSQSFNYTMDIIDTTLNKFYYLAQSNPYPRLADFFYVLPSVFSPIIRCEYFLVITLDFNSFVTKGYLPKVCLPVFLSHQSEKDFDLEKQENDDMKKAIEASLLDMEKNNDINDINITNEKDDKDGNEILIEKPKKEGEENENDENNIENKDEDNIDNENNKKDENDNDNDNNINEIKDENNIDNNINEIKEENNIDNNINEIKEENNNDNNINEIKEENNINNNDNEIKEENNNNNINEIKEENNINNNDNEIKEENNNNNNNINIDEMMSENINKIKFGDDTDIINPYSENNNLGNNFSINDEDEESVNNNAKNKKKAKKKQKNNEKEDDFSVFNQFK